MRIDEEKKEALRMRTVAVVLELRAQYLADGANPLKHWQQIHDRLRMAARTSASVPEWATAMQRSLKIATPSSSLSSAILQLADEAACIPDPCWLDLIDQEHGYIMALARAESEDRREQRQRRGQAEIDPETGEVTA